MAEHPETIDSQRADAAGRPWQLWLTIAAVVAVLAAGAVTVLLVSGDGSKPAARVGTDPAPSASVPSASAPAADPAAATDGLPCPTEGDIPTPSRADVAAFAPVAALQCVEDSRVLDGGEWLVRIRRATGDVAAMQRAYAMPDEPPTSGACATVAIVVPATTLVDADGHTLSPAAPHDECGQPQQRLRDAFAAASWQETGMHRIRETVTPAARAAHCDMQWKNENFLYAEDGNTTPSAGGPVAASTPDAVHVCLYSPDGKDPEVGDFTDVRDISGSDVDTLFRALAGAGPTASCSGPHDFAVIRSGDVYLNVELGGCWRVQREDGDTGTADPSVVRRVLRLDAS